MGREAAGLMTLVALRGPVADLIKSALAMVVSEGLAIRGFTLMIGRWAAFALPPLRALASSNSCAFSLRNHSFCLAGELEKNLL